MHFFLFSFYSIFDVLFRDKVTTADDLCPTEKKNQLERINFRCATQYRGFCFYFFSLTFFSLVIIIGVFKQKRLTEKSCICV